MTGSQNYGNIFQRPLIPGLRLERPLFATTVHAGFPSPADDYIESLLDLNEHLVSNPAATFYVRVTGDSMIKAGILPGDVLVVDRSLVAGNGSIVIAVVDGELAVKRLRKANGVCELHSENSRFPPIQFREGMELLVWGVVSGVIRKF